MKPWKEWFEEVKCYRQLNEGQYIIYYFGRNPIRPIFYNPNYMYSPADGVITFAKVVEPDDEIIRIKGRKLTLKELMNNPDYNKKSIVINIFMTYYDVHYNRIPTSGYIEVKSLPVLAPQNLPMVDFERELFEKGAINNDLCGFLRNNERDIVRVYYPLYNLTYYIIQIADEEVNVIAQFYKGRTYVKQGDRITFICFGSSVVLVVPVENHNFKILAKEGFHVEAGIDPLIEIISDKKI